MKKRSKEVRIEYELTDMPIMALGDQPVVKEAAQALGIDHLFNRYLHIKLRSGGYTEYELAMAVILTLLAGNLFHIENPHSLNESSRKLIWAFVS